MHAHDTLAPTVAASEAGPEHRGPMTEWAREFTTAGWSVITTREDDPGSVALEVQWTDRETGEPLPLWTHPVRGTWATDYVTPADLRALAAAMLAAADAAERTGTATAPALQLA